MAEAYHQGAEDAAEKPIPVQFLSYEEQREKTYVLLTEEARRIRWRLNGPLSTAVSVMEHWQIDPDNAVFEPYHTNDGETGPAGSWHPLSQSPYTTPKVSSINIAVEALDEWINYWLERHEEHYFERAKPRFGPLPEDDSKTVVTTEEREDGRFREACCGTDRPVNKTADLVVKATGDFITIHDFLSAVHPYLMDRRADIVAAMREDQYRGNPVPAEDGLFVDPAYASPDFLSLSDEKEWLKSHRHRDYKVVNDAATQARLQSYEPKLRAHREQVMKYLAERRAAERAAAG
ncbi:hypothetical protein GE09DRAFT_1279224 [Coniochaeta sp. 2T2.1]|nr:hypothetical protein GE09DRAFT_1279224 [Coniochaeta sp. 2T2.1]